MRLVDTRGRTVKHESPAAGHTLSGRFSFQALVPGRYTVETTIRGTVWKAPVTIGIAKEVRANIVIPIQ